MSIRYFFYICLLLSMPLQAMHKRLIKSARRQLKISRLLRVNRTIRGFCDRKSTNNKLLSYRLKLGKKTQQAFDNVKKEFGVDDTTWQSLAVAYRHEALRYYKGLKQPNDAVKHDTAISNTKRNDIYKALQNVNIHPESINICFLNNQTQEDEEKTIALAALELYEPLMQKPFDLSLSITRQYMREDQCMHDDIVFNIVLMHEITHLKRAHPLKGALLSSFLQQYNVDLNKQYESIQSLIKCFEVEADVLPALQSKKQLQLLDWHYSNEQRKETETHPSSDEILEHLDAIKRIHENDE